MWVQPSAMATLKGRASNTAASTSLKPVHQTKKQMKTIGRHCAVKIKDGPAPEAAAFTSLKILHQSKTGLEDNHSLPYA